jgi:hypothetical protein
MTTDTKTSYNRFAIAAGVLAIVAFAGMIFFSIAGFAVFAVGAGHVAIDQIKTKGGRGKELGVAALIVGYAVGIWSIFAVIQFLLSAAAQQM